MRAPEDVNISRKVVAIAMDNVNVNKAMVDELADVQKKEDGIKTSWVRCSCHILNLIITAGMEPKEGLIEKVRTVAKAFKRSQRRLHDLESYCKDHNEKFRSPMVDVATRWNSTYDMINRLFSMRRTISYLIDKPKYLEDKENKGLQVHITNMEWDAIKCCR